MERAKLLRVDGSSFNKLKQLVLKVLGAKSTYTAEEYAPHGTDSRPVKGMTAIYMRSERDGDECIIGYLIKDRNAEIGEHRIFSTDQSGAFKFNVWLRADGKLLIGDSINPSAYTNNAVQFNELKVEFNELKAKFNALVSAYNTHVHPYVNGSTPAVTSTTPTTGTASTANIDNAKNAKIKTN